MGDKPDCTGANSCKEKDRQLFEVATARGERIEASCAKLVALQTIQAGQTISLLTFWSKSPAIDLKLLQMGPETNKEEGLNAPTLPNHCAQLKQALHRLHVLMRSKAGSNALQACSSNRES